MVKLRHLIRTAGRKRLVSSRHVRDGGHSGTDAPKCVWPQDSANPWIESALPHRPSHAPYAVIAKMHNIVLMSYRFRGVNNRTETQLCTYQVGDVMTRADERSEGD